MRRGQPRLRPRGGVLRAVSIGPGKKLTPEALWALWALLAGIGFGMLAARLSGG